MKDPMHSRQILRLLFWESTIRCNLTCAHCRRIESDEQAHTDMSTAQAKALIEQLAELGVGRIMIPAFFFGGEGGLDQMSELGEKLRPLSSK